MDTKFFFVMWVVLQVSSMVLTFFREYEAGIVTGLLAMIFMSNFFNELKHPKQ